VSYRQTLYTPIVTLWAWMSQVLDSDKSLSNAVSRIIAWLATAGETVPSDTGAYSKARKHPLTVLQPLLKQTADALQMEVKPEQWCGRRTYDGTTVLMSDTIANQQSYPQHSNQKVGCGFPLAKLVVWFCDNRSVWKLQWQRLPPVSGNWHGNSMPLQPGDVVVADSAYGTYVDLALVHSANADAVFGNIMRVTVIFVGARSWALSYCPMAASWAMSSINASRDFGALPASIEVREVHLLIQRPGFRPKSFGHHFS